MTISVHLTLDRRALSVEQSPRDRHQELHRLGMEDKTLN